MAIYANVIIDISIDKLDKTFQYKIPQSMCSQIQIGMQVIVPFGNGQRQMKGYVIELTDEAEYDVTKLKEIKSLCQDSVQIENKLIALAGWIRKNYGGTMNHALRTVLPVKQKTQAKEKKKLILLLKHESAKEQLKEFQRKHNTARARLLEALIANPCIEYEVVRQKLNIDTHVIQVMEKLKILQIEKERTYRNPLKDNAAFATKQFVLNEQQQQIVDTVVENQRNEKEQTYLIHGVTGSGKTVVYIEIIAKVVEQKRQAIVLIPEISLTYQTVMRFYERFGERVSIMNSKLSQGERYDQFLRAKRGEIDVMIGPRSALFTPFSNLGIIVIDEEHESSYKSESIPRYHARETAIQRAKMSGASVILGSATPSIESYYKALHGEYELFTLTKRVEQKPLPICYNVDLREELKSGNRSILSYKLQELMQERLDKKEQIMLFLNRRGVSGFVSCRSCGHVMKCPHCDVSLNWHNTGKLVCHYCGYETASVSKCPTCGSSYISGFKAGTQKIEALVKKRFPEAKILRMDADTTRQKDDYEKILSSFANQQADILIGTQMIVKGHDFANVTLVGILAADLSLNVSDYRASERTFQLLTQAAGRAGRGAKEGEVVIQSYHPTHYSIKAAQQQDYLSFYEQEMEYRKMLCYPPIWHMMVILCASRNEQSAYRLADRLKRIIQTYMQKKIHIIGPADASVSKVNDIYKKVLYLKNEEYQILVEIKDKLEHFIQKETNIKDVAVQFDFNPMNGF